MSLRRARRPLILSGEVLSVRLIVEFEGSSKSEKDTVQWEDLLWSIAQQQGHHLREQLNAAIHEHLGPEFDIRSLSYARGSLEILVVIGTLYYAAHYKNFIENVELLVAHFRRISDGFFERWKPDGTRISVKGTWSPGIGLVQGIPRARDDQSTVVWYLIVSHAAMLAGILWLLLIG